MTPFVVPPATRTAIRKRLLAWYDREKRDVPWRRRNDGYSVWLSEIILQQTRVDQGTPYYERFIAAFPTVADLANAPEDRVLKLWEGLGYYSRARNLHKAAKVIAAQHDGEFPDSVDELTALPGVGRYTAGAIASIAYGKRAPLVDGNVARVFARVFDIGEPIENTNVKNELWRLAEDLVPPNRPGDFNQALMEFGARLCTPRTPGCHACPVASYCAAKTNGTIDERPVRKVKKVTPHYEMVCAALKRDGAYLIAQRKTDGLLGGLWEFPSGRLEKGEDHPAALKRTCRELLGITAKPGGLIATVTHAYSHFRITMSVYSARITRGTPEPKAHDAIAWVTPENFDDYAFPKANHKFLPLL